METQEVKTARLEEKMDSMERAFNELKVFLKESNEDLKKWFLAEINSSAGSLRSDVNHANSGVINNKTKISELQRLVENLEKEVIDLKKRIGLVEKVIEKVQDKTIFVGQLTKSMWGIFIAIISAISVIIGIVMQLITN